MHLVQVRFQIDGADGLPVQNNPFNDDEPAVFKPTAIGAAQHRTSFDRLSAPVAGKRGAVRRVDATGHNVVPGFELGQEL